MYTIWNPHIQMQFKSSDTIKAPSDAEYRPIAQRTWRNVKSVSWWQCDLTLFDIQEFLIDFNEHVYFLIQPTWRNAIRSVHVATHCSWRLYGQIAPE